MNLIQQAIADWLEIIVVDSASEEGEASIIREFQGRFGNIICMRTAKRENVYCAWNRGIKFAAGKYATNANTSKKQQENKEILKRYRLAAHQHNLIGGLTERDQNSDVDPSQAKPKLFRTRDDTQHPNKSTYEAKPQGGHPINSPETILKASGHMVEIGQDDSALWDLDKLIADFPENAQLHN